MTNARLDQLKFAIVLVLFSVSLLWLLRSLFLGTYPDFSVYYHASRYFVDGHNPYLAGKVLSTGYSYPPTVLLLFAPFLLLPFQFAGVLWTALNIILLLYTLYILSRTFSFPLFSRINMFLSSLVFLAFPTKFTLGMGQINIVILFLLVSCVYFLKQKKEFTSGLLVGMSLVIKLFPLLLPVYLFLTMKTKIILGISVTFLGSLVVLLIFVPFKTSLYFFQSVVPDFFSSSWKLEYYSQSTSAFVGRTFGIGEIGSLIKIIISLAIVGTVLYAVFSNRRNDFGSLSLKIGILICATILINTFSWQHHFIWLIIPFYATVFFIRKHNLPVKWYVLLFVSYILVSVNYKDPQVLPIILQSHMYFGALTLFICNLRLLFLNIQK